MTSKDYKIITDALALSLSELCLNIEQSDIIISAFSIKLKQDNPRFEDKIFREYITERLQHYCSLK